MQRKSRPRCSPSWVSHVLSHESLCVVLYILILFMVTVVAASERSSLCSSLALLFAGKIDCDTITRKELTQDLESSHGE